MNKINNKCFDLDNNQKWISSSKSAYYYDFWRSCDTENTALITEINYILVDINIENSCFKLKKNIIQFLQYFW